MGEYFFRHQDTRIVQAPCKPAPVTDVLALVASGPGPSGELPAAEQEMLDVALEEMARYLTSVPEQARATGTDLLEKLAINHNRL